MGSDRDKENPEEETEEILQEEAKEESADEEREETSEEEQEQEEPSEEGSGDDSEEPAEKEDPKDKKIAELNDKVVRQMAEFDNFRKRVMQEKADLIKNGGTKVITTLLPIIDDLERAQQNMDKYEDVAAVKEGLNLIIEKFFKLMAQEGLKKMDVVGQPFDADLHEAIAMVPGQPDEQKGKVMDCMMAGYTLNDKVIRYAKVAVAE